MYYFIKYEYEGKIYKCTVLPEENAIIRLMSLTNSNSKIIEIKAQRAY